MAEISSEVARVRARLPGSLSPRQRARLVDTYWADENLNQALGRLDTEMRKRREKLKEILSQEERVHRALHQLLEHEPAKCDWPTQRCSSNDPDIVVHAELLQRLAEREPEDLRLPPLHEDLDPSEPWHDKCSVLSALIIDFELTQKEAALFLLAGRFELRRDDESGLAFLAKLESVYAAVRRMVSDKKIMRRRRR